MVRKISKHKAFNLLPSKTIRHYLRLHIRKLLLRRLKSNGEFVLLTGDEKRLETNLVKNLHRNNTRSLLIIGLTLYAYSFLCREPPKQTSIYGRTKRQQDGQIIQDPGDPTSGPQLGPPTSGSPESAAVAEQFRTDTSVGPAV